VILALTARKRVQKSLRARLSLPWTSDCQHGHEFLHLSLERQQLAGDAVLAACSTGRLATLLQLKSGFCIAFAKELDPKKSLAALVSLFGRHRFCEALELQVHEHGRWRHPRSSEQIDRICQAWTLHERLQINVRQSDGTRTQVDIQSAFSHASIVCSTAALQSCVCR
jgi:hypothetical protein